MKKNIGPVNALYPMPVVLVGAMVDGRANFITIAHVGIFTLETISLGVNRSHYTNRGIRENRTFSVNFPSDGMVVETDYAGLASGKQTDKSSVFEVEFGPLKTAPMIKNAPVSMECGLLDVLDYGNHDVFVGRAVNTYADESVLKNGVIDLAAVRPMLFDMFQRKYWRLGGPFADCWSVGKNYAGGKK
ncbi:MAG: flavin reductase family protein [Spirochaetes bacterium]|jgi:flavin reductase (DIM6/NTAB) family NADH-FMN oxidoreductase RutF|nr:flavin reductase family protein [Spirochaetota bacterium]